jgi:2-polyprenyl-3-methyl-5-hydroxy-6-metoxy-1,4-benzoquinol methylase
MNRGAIRPEQLVAENLGLHRQDLEDFMVHAKDFIEVACPACGLDVPDFQFNKDGFRHHRCPDCGTLYIRPRPTREMLMEFYNTARSIKHWKEVLYPATEQSRISNIFAPRATLVHGLNSKSRGNGRLVDVGAGYGTFAKLMQNMGYDAVMVVEPSHDMAEVCRSKGLEVIEKAVEDVELRDISVITCWELLEHLCHPGIVLESFHRALLPDGLLFLTTPNWEGFDLQILEEKSDNVGGPNHLQLFTPRSIRQLLDLHGFEVIRLDTPGSLDVHNVRWKAQMGDVLLHGWWERIILDEDERVRDDFQRFLSRNGLSSHMRVVARRRP